LHREDSQRRETRRSAGAAADQIRDRDQPQDRQGAWYQNLRQPALARRRGDRVSNCHLVAARSLIDLATSRLALRAPALRAATPLPRQNRSAHRLLCALYTVPTVMTIGQNNIVTNHCVEGGDHLTHHRHDRYLRLLSGGLEAVMERLEPRIPITGTH